MESIVSQALIGVSYGLLLFMLAAGLTLIFSMMGVLNFAHASFYMLGAYVAYQISTWIGFWAALVLAPLALFALGAFVERWGLRRVHKWGHVPELLFTFGLSYIVVEMVQVIWGRAAVPYRVPAELDGPVGWLQSFNVIFPQYRMFMMAVAIAMLEQGRPKHVRGSLESALEPHVYAALVMGVRDYVGKNRFPGVLLGLSGGIDSALTLAIAVDALGRERVRTVMMPSPYNAPISMQDAREMAGILGVRSGRIEIGAPGDLVLFDPEAAMRIAPETLKSQGKNTPFLGYELQGRVRATIVAGKVVYEGA